MNNKKGISAVVATVLIILITVAAVTIIWAAIIPMINHQINSGTTCLDAVSQVGLVTDKGYTCYNESTKTVSIQVSHGAKDFALADLQVLVSAGGDTTSFTKDNFISGANTLPGVNEDKVIKINVSNMAGTPDSVSIAPIVSVGQTEEPCDVSATAVLSAC